MIELTKFRDVKIYSNNVEQSALDQIERLMSIPVFSDCKVRIMPDVHVGAGCVIGFTANLGDRVIPNIVGVDIGCGISVDKISKDTKITDFKKLDNIIREFIPSGMQVRDNINDFNEVQLAAYSKCREWITQLKCFRELKDAKRLYRSIGTLGGGNHFIEIDVDAEGNQYLAIHTGSRNLGLQVAKYYQTLAVKNMSGWDKLMKMQEALIAEYKAAGRKSELQSAIAELHRNFRAVNPDVPNELRWLEDKYRLNYLHDMVICQNWAAVNRALISSIIADKLNLKFEDSFETVHNYIDLESNLIRKGAVSAKLGEKLIIPMNMRDGSLICVGKGNADWNYSAPHGAGRLMSRAQAFKELKLSDFEESMKGINTWSVSEDTIDEAPMVYKPMSEIVNQIEDTVDIIDVIKPVYNFKAASDFYAFIQG